MQACLKYIFGRDLGSTGLENDGVDGIFGNDTEEELATVLDDLGIPTITNAAGWKKFLALPGFVWVA